MADAGAGPRGQRRRGRGQRDETYAEIVEAARRLMRTEDGLSLRGVAAEMGMTPPALYRYVDSYRDLQVLVARAVTADLVAELRRTVEAVPGDDPAAQIVLAALAFRSWALANPAEFGIAFANAELAQRFSPEPGAAGGAVAAVFADLYQRLSQRHRIEVDIPEDFVREPPPPDSVWPTLESAGMAWLMLRHWVRTYGIVTLEVHRQVPLTVIESGSLFLAAIGDNAVELGIGADFPRLRALVQAELAKRPFTTPTQ